MFADPVLFIFCKHKIRKFLKQQYSVDIQNWNSTLNIYFSAFTEIFIGYFILIFWIGLTYYTVFVLTTDYPTPFSFWGNDWPSFGNRSWYRVYYMIILIQMYSFSMIMYALTFVDLINVFHSLLCIYNYRWLNRFQCISMIYIPDIWYILYFTTI